jgi:hypothetical protein
LVCSLLGAQRLDHFLNVASHHIRFLLLCSERPFRTLEPLLLVLLLFGGILRIFPHRAVISVPKVHAQLLRWHEGWLHAHLLFLLQKNA